MIVDPPRWTVGGNRPATPHGLGRARREADVRAMWPTRFDRAAPNASAPEGLVKIDYRSGSLRVLGHRLYYETLGNGSRGTVLGLHGGPGGTHTSLHPLLDLAQSGYRVVLYDQLGCGRSERPRSYRGLTIERLADEADALRRTLGLGRCHLFGYSFGGALALQTILRHPWGFRSLVVGSGYASERQMEAETRRLVALLPEADRSVIRSTEAQDRVRGRRYQRAVAEFLRRHVSDLSVPPVDLFLTLANMNPAITRALVGGDDLTRPATGSIADWDVRSELHRIRVPALITVGRRDHVSPRCARTIARGIRGARLVVFGQSGHDAMFKERDRYIGTVRDFLARVR